MLSLSLLLLFLFSALGLGFRLDRGTKSTTLQAMANRGGGRGQRGQRIVEPERAQAILWDVDGTLSDSFNLGFTSTKTVLANNGKASISEDEYHQGTKFTTPRRLAWHVTGDPDDPSGIALGQQFDDLYVKLVSTETAPLYEGIQELLDAVKREHAHVKYGALSNACGAYVEAVLRVNNLNEMFEVRAGADEVPAAKPSGDGLLQCSAALQVPPHLCVYVGDSPTDAMAATAAGYMASIGVLWGSHPEKAVRDAFTVVATSPIELELLIMNLCEFGSFLWVPKKYDSEEDGMV